MHATLFDSYAYVQKLRKAGVDEAQAAIQAEALLEDRLATKQDVADRQRDMAAMEASLKRDIKAMDLKIETVRSELKQDLALVETSLRKDLALVEANLRGEIKGIDGQIASAKAGTLKWTTGMFVAQTALVMGVLFSLVKLNPPNVQPTAYPPPAQEMRLSVPATVPPVVVQPAVPRPAP